MAIPQHIKQLFISGVRNLAPADLSLGPQINLITGANGSGKTSVLESVYLLATTRSFRTARTGSVVNYEASELLVRAEISGDELPGGAATVGSKLAIARTRGGDITCRVNGVGVSSATEMAAHLPVQVIEPDSVLLVTGGPDLRRRMVDWGLFHVEPSIAQSFRAFRRVLHQRNAALRTKSVAGLDVWDQQFLAAAEPIHLARQQYVERLKPVVQEELAALAGGFEIEMSYRAGWDEDQPLMEVMAAQRDRELKLGYSLYGPQRADLRLSAFGRSAAESLSRGQQKVLAYSLLIAQSNLLVRESDSKPVFLVDDLLAELDLNHARQTLARLVAGKGQVLITGVDAARLVECLPTDVLPSVFHVEHGEITAQPEIGA